MFESAFRSIDDTLWKDAGCTGELDYIEQTSWLLFLKYLDDYEQELASQAVLEGRAYSPLMDERYQWRNWAAPKNAAGHIDYQRALTGDDLLEFVNEDLFPYLERFKRSTDDPDEPNPPGEGGDEDDPEGGEKPEKIRIRLSDGKVREIQHTTATLFYLHGKPVSAAEYIKYLYDDVSLPTLLGSEDDLRTAWSNPVTRDELLRRLADAGCSRADLGVLQTLINAEDCDLFDVLEYIAYTKPTLKREQRAQYATANVQGFLKSEQREFVSYVLRSYVKAGVDELSYQRLTPALNAVYGNIREAEQRLGPVEDIKEVFEQAQQALYMAEAG